MMFRSLLVAATLLATPAAAGDLTPAAAGEVLDQVSKGLDTYIFPDVAKRAQASLKAHRTEFLKLDTREAFAAAVSKDLYATTHDGHLKVSVQAIAADRGATITEAQQALIDRHLAYGLMSIRRLPGNVGYLKLSYFEQGPEGAALIDTALRLLKDTDALIIDLRQNRGGGGSSDEQLLGHLSKTPIPMARITWRNPDGTTIVDQRTPAQPVGGPLYPEKPVFVLTAKRTFSAAEALAYDLQAAHRATLVGETTGGAANPANREAPLSYGFRIFIPNGHVEHPTTHANWEGVGVAPDVAVAPGDALSTAYGLALKAAAPTIATPKSEKERAAALAEPTAALLADQAL
jgi:C-terminal processing protease CtpA/Prc